VDVEIRTLGGFEVVVDGRSLDRADWQRSSAERLVKLLAVTPGHAATRELLAETLWPDAPAGLAQTSLRKALHFARHALPDGAIAADATQVRLASGRVDLDRLLASLEMLRRPGDTGHRPADAMREDAIRTALDLGQRPLLPDDVYEDWVAPLRDQLSSRWQVVALDAARASARDGRTAEALRVVDAILAADPADEAAHRLAIECYVAEGRHHAARRQLEWCRRALAGALDAQPQPETEAALGPSAGDEPSRSRTPADRPIVGRSDELARLRALRERVEGRHAACVVVRGPAGIGKTRLLDALRDEVARAGWRELAWTGIPSAVATAFAPFVLRLGDLVPPGVDWPEPERSALATLVPAMGLRPEMTFADRSALVFALFCVLRRLVERQPLLLAVDDVAWLDPSSADVVEAVTAVLADAPILVALAVRDDEQIPARARDLVDRLVHAGGLDLRLGPLDEADVEPLVLSHLGGRAVAAELTRALARQSEGNPLFCLELVRSGVAAGGIGLVDERWVRGADARSAGLPETVRQLVRSRAAGLPGRTREVLEITAMLGEEAPFAVLRAVVEEDPAELIRALDDAMAAGLLVERAGGYAFAHPLFRAAIEASAGIAGRAVLDWKIARALSGAGETAEAAVASARGHHDPEKVAVHALRAVEQGMAEAQRVAVAFGFESGARAVARFERETAVEMLQRAVLAWERLPADERGAFDAARALMCLAELHTAANDEAGARAAYRRSIEAARTPKELAIVFERFMWLPYRHGDFEGTLTLGREALLRLPPGAREARAVVESHVGWTLGRLHRLDESIEVLRSCVRAMEDAEDSPERSVAFDRLGMMLDFAGRHDEALQLLERALAVSLACHDARSEMCRLHLAASLTRSGRPAEARPHAQRALELAHLMGDWYIESVAAWSAAEVEDALGDPGAARRLRERELALLARIGGNSHNEAFSHAHLAHIARRMGEEATAEREAALARGLAAKDAEPGYLARIETAMAAARWSEVASG
jgi:DNA-binding SARP family transcriptional activator